MISVIVPVLSRPQNAQYIYTSFAANTLDATMTFVCTAGDDAQIKACKDTGAKVLIASWAPGPGDFARKINHGFANTDSEFVFMGADDIEFTPRWDDVALRMMRGRIGVVATNDKANRQVMRGEFGTHCLISRAYIDEHGGTFDGEPGVVLYEGYDHNFVDRELCEAAKRRRAFAYAAHSVVHHHHPLWRTAPWDRTYRKALARFHEDQTLFLERSRTAKRNRDSVVSR